MQRKNSISLFLAHAAIGVACGLIGTQAHARRGDSPIDKIVQIRTLAFDANGQPTEPDSSRLCYPQAYGQAARGFSESRNPTNENREIGKILNLVAESDTDVRILVDIIQRKAGLRVDQISISFRYALLIGDRETDVFKTSEALVTSEKSMWAADDCSALRDLPFARMALETTRLLQTAVTVRSALTTISKITPNREAILVKALEGSQPEVVGPLKQLVSQKRAAKAPQARRQETSM